MTGGFFHGAEIFLSIEILFFTLHYVCMYVLLYCILRMYVLYMYFSTYLHKKS